jgi:hypothetical protein
MKLEPMNPAPPVTMILLCMIVDGKCSRAPFWGAASTIKTLLPSVAQGEGTVGSGGLSLRVLNDCGRSLLTPREEQVVALVSEGMSNRDVSHELSLSEYTVKKVSVSHLRQAGRVEPRGAGAVRSAHGDARPPQFAPQVPVAMAVRAISA